MMASRSMLGGVLALSLVISEVVASHTFVWTACLMVLCHCIDASLLTLPLPLCLFFIILLERKGTRSAYWVGLMRYLIVVLMLQFSYQLPIFCGSPALTVRMSGA